MSLYKLIVFTGSKGSGKSSLIKALFPELDVRFDEPPYYRDYMLAGGLAVREIAGRKDTLEIITTVASRWNISVGLLVADSLRPIESIAEPLFLAVIGGAERKTLVANKIDEPQSRVQDLEKLASERGLEFFAVSSRTGEGVEDLKTWILTGERRVKPKPLQPTILRPPYPVDLIPVVARKIPDKSRLTQEELEIFELCDGKRSMSEIALRTGRSYGDVKKIIDLLMAKGFIDTLKSKAT